VIFRLFPERLRSWISFVISKSASFTRFVRSTVTEFPFSISIVSLLSAGFSVAPVRFWSSVPELFRVDRSMFCVPPASVI